jgi:hypothetical protein
LRELHFTSLNIDEGGACLADALLLGGGGGPAPNLEELSFEDLEEDTVEQLASELFARGALANITTLIFSSVDFTKHSMGALMDGFRQSGHQGRKLKNLRFVNCSEDDESAIPPAKVSFPLIEGLRDGLFPILEELYTPCRGLLVGIVAEMLEMVRGGAPCGRMLKSVTLGEKGRPSDLEALQALLAQATVVIE